MGWGQKSGGKGDFSNIAEKRENFFAHGHCKNFALRAKKARKFFRIHTLKNFKETSFLLLRPKEKKQKKMRAYGKRKKKHAVYLVCYESQGQGAKALPTAPLTFLRPAVLRLRFFSFFLPFFSFFSGKLAVKEH